MFIQNADKKIVYWGIGFICKLCLEQYYNIQPVLFIDSRSERDFFHGKPVKRPDEIEDWSSYYIIITIKSDDALEHIRGILKAKGLKEGRDFGSYKDVFECSVPSVRESVNLLGNFMNKHTEAANPIMLLLPFEIIRDSINFESFISSYIRARKPTECLFFSSLYVLSEQEASLRFGCPVFCLPDLSDGKTEDGGRLEKLSDEERGWIREMEGRKRSSDQEKSIEESEAWYRYFKTVLEIVRPSKIIYWGNWSRESYILGHLAGMCGVPYGYMEHGWLPGTYQVDPRGIMGQSEYAVNPRMFDAVAVDAVYEVERIKAYIKERKLDTRVFVETAEDNAALAGVDKTKKTVFLVGMDDHGMEMNPDCEYWKTYISGVVRSTEEALLALAAVCEKRNWNLIFKPHPGNPAPEIAGCKERVTFVRETEIDRLIKMADVVVSICSAVDYKTLIYGKPLVQLGINGLLGKGCSYIVGEAAELEDQLALALKEGMTGRQKENFDRLLQILLQRYLWDDRSERTLRYGLTVERDFIDG